MGNLIWESAQLRLLQRHYPYDTVPHNIALAHIVRLAGVSLTLFFVANASFDKTLLVGLGGVLISYVLWFVIIASRRQED